MERFYQNPRPLQIGHDLVKIEVKRGNHGIKRALRDFFQNYSLEQETGTFDGIDIPAGSIESLVVRRTLENVYVNGNLVQFVSNDPIDDLPDIGMGDEEDDIDLYVEILKTCVDANRYLARKYPYNMVFAQYLAMVNEDKRRYEEKMNAQTGASIDKVDREDAVGPDPTPSPEDTFIGERISGGAITGTTD